MIATSTTPSRTADLLFRLSTVEDVDALIRSVPDARWAPLGGKPNNYAQINVGSGAVDALMEKITNGMDALVEREAALCERFDFDSPREAAHHLLGVPEGHVRNLTDAAARRTLAAQLVMTLRDSGTGDPTVAVEDRGVGQHPDAFPRTLVSLNEENKRDKFYLLGAYGWGGAASYAFCAYSVYVSRRDPRLLGQGQRDEVGWTVVRFNDLAQDRNSKTGVYEYLCVDALGSPAVPRFDATDLPEDRREWSGTNCTLVRYQLGRYAGAPTFRPSGSLLVLCNALLFDPVMPFTLRDERPKSVQMNREHALNGMVISGNAARLAWAATRRMKRIADSGDAQDGEGVSYERTFHGRLSTGSRVDVHYWVIADRNEHKQEDPTRTYVPPEQAITVTHNGQRHEAIQRTTFEKLGLLALSKYLIVQVDCDRLTWPDKRQLFSTTRDRLKDTAIAQELRNQIAAALRSDTALKREEETRKQRALGRQSKEHAERIKKLLDQAIDTLREGNQLKNKGVLSGNLELPLMGDQPLLDESPPDSKEDRDDEDAAVVEFSGDPTFLRVLNSPVRVPSGGRAVVRLQLDAPDDYFSPGRGDFVPIVSRGGEVFRAEGYSSLRNGLMRCTVSAKGGTAGDRGRVLFTVTRKGLPPLIDEAELEVAEPYEKRVKPAGKAPGKERGPAVVPVHRNQWSTFSFTEHTVAKLSPHANDPSMVTVYVNWDYPALNEKLLGEKKFDIEVADSHKVRFMASMALLSWLQHQDGIDVQEAELRRAANMYLFSTFMGG